MQMIKIFGEHDFELHEPEVGTLPDFLQPRWSVALNRSALVRELAQAQDRETAERALRRYVERAEQAVLMVGRGFYPVKIGKGKTERSRRIALACARGPEPDAPAVTSRFYAPAALVVLAPPGARGHQDAFLPAFWVREKLKEVAARAVYARQQFERVPRAKPCWPAHLIQQFLESLLSQLPAAHVIEAERLARDRERARLAAQRTAIAPVTAQQREAVRAELQARERALELRRARRNAKMPIRTNVNVRWTTWTSLRRRFLSHEHHAQNVSVRVAGAVSYVICPDGREVRVATKNLEYV